MKKLFVLLIALLLCVGAAQAEISAAADLNAPGVTVGVDQGSAAELTVRELLPQASVAYFTDKFMGYTAVAQGKIDAFAYDRNQMKLAIEGGLADVRLLDETLGEPIQIAVGLSPVSQIPDLESKINRFIGELRADGTLDDMYQRWVTDENETMPKITLPGSPSLHLTVGTSGIVPPYSYYQDGKLNGYDIELAYRFAAWLGADVEFKVYDYGAIIPAALSGDVDCVMANLNLTPERQEALTFSDVLYEDVIGIMVRSDAPAETAAAPAEPAPAWAAYNGKRLGVLVGPLMEDIAHANFPDSEYMLFNSYPDCITALVSGRIDAYLGDEPGLKSVHAEQPQIDYIHERITNQEYSFAFRKDDPESAKLCEELNAFLTQSHADGTMQELDDIWFGVDEDRKVVDMNGLTGENGTIRVVTTSTDMPWSYIKDGKNVGYDIDLVVRFCRAAGYKLELGDVDFAARIPAIQSGKYDFTTDMNVTEERKEQVLFSDPTSTGGVVLAILTDGAEAKADPAATAETLSPLAWNGRRMGIVTGTSFEAVTLQYYPDSQYLYFDSNSDVVTALTQKKIDGFLADEPVIRVICKEVPEITYLTEKITQDDYAFGFGKNSERADLIRGQFNEMLAQIMADGTMNALYDKWFGDDENAKAVDLTGFSGENGVLNVVTTSSSIPFSYIKDGNLAGIAIELTEMFCRRYGYTPKIEDVAVAARIPGLVTGKYDMCAAPLTITEERRESINFSDPYYKGGIVLAARKADVGDAAAEPDPFARFSGKRIGVGVGTASGQQVEARIPDAILSYYNNQTDLLAALRANKIDAWGTDETVPKFIMMENDDLMIVDGYLDTFEYAPIFAKTEKGRALRDQYSAFVDGLWADGTMQELDEIWYGKDESKRTVLDYEALPATNGTLRMAVDTSVVPFAYMKDNRVVGYDVDIAARFCQQNGYRLEVLPMDFGGILAAVQSGRVDFSATGITVTEERGESVLFGSANYRTGAVLAVLKDSSEQAEETESAPAVAARPTDWNGRPMGIMTGTSFEAPTLEFFPDSEYLYYNSYTDVAAALVNKKIDGFLGDEPALRILVGEVPEITYLSEKLVSDEYAFGFGKSGARADTLRGQFNEMLAEIMADGTLDALSEKWFGDDEAAKTVDLKNGFSGENGKLNVVTTATDVPFSYVKDNEYVGLSIELVEKFCRRYGYTPVIADVDFSARMPGLVSGKYDMCASSMAITEERKESISFSEPFYQGGIVLAVRKADVPAQTAESVSLTGGVEAALTLDALNGKRVGVQTGTICGALAESRLPDAQVYYFNTVTDVLAALNTGKVDGGCMDEPTLRFLKIENPDLAILDEYLDESNLAAVFPKTEVGQALRDQYSEFLDRLWADGTMQEIDDIWFGEDEARRTIMDFSSLPAANGTLRMAADLSMVPFTYMKDNRIMGYDVDIAARFCQEYGYGLEIMPMEFGGILPAVQSGKCDFASSCITVTAERAESVLFSVPNYYGGIAMAVWNENSAAGQSAAQVEIGAISQLDGMRIGVQTGTTFDAIVLEALPNAKISYFNSYPDMAAALEAHKIDGFPGDEPVLLMMTAEDPQLAILSERMDIFETGFAMPKTEAGEKLLGELNAWIASMQESGDLEKIVNKWTVGKEADKTLPDYAAFPAPNGMLTLATEGAYAPFNYYREGKVVGMEIDLAAQFCQANGYGLKVEAMNFDGILPAVQTGKANFAAAGISITEERKESVNFSDPYYIGGTVMAVLKTQPDKAGIPAGVYTSLSELAGKKIGVQTGTSFDKSVIALLPDAQVEYYNSKPDMINALQTYKIDAYAVDEPVAKAQMQQNDKLTYIPEYMESFDFAYVFAKNEAGQALCDQFSEYLDTIRADGTMAEIEAKWFSEDESVKTLADYKAFPATNGTLNMATEAMYEPFSYVKGNEIVGYDIDIVVRFCQAYGYGLTITDMSFDAVLPAVQSGKCDFGGAGITITEERKESVLFSSPNFSGGTVMAVLKAESQPAAQAQPAAAESTQSATPAAAAPSGFSVFWEGIKSSFNKTFLRENRWQLFLEGIGNTMLITALAILFGTALGFVLFMLCRNGNPVANGTTRFSMWLVQGTPMVVLLMILYYIIFGRVAISGIAVAVIGFTLTFGAAVLGMLRMGVGMIDRGQYEAAYALGHSNRHTFFKIILPQAIPHVLPAFQGEIVGLIKATAIVGYIAVQDLTKMGDIVRSRTYDAFFPLIAITVIYFVLEGLFSFAVSRISIHIDPKKRKRENILKGVNLHD